MCGASGFLQLLCIVQLYVIFFHLTSSGVWIRQTFSSLLLLLLLYVYMLDLMIESLKLCIDLMNCL
jgi:membrane-bound ClpP family serine protease